MLNVKCKKQQLLQEVTARSNICYHYQYVGSVRVHASALIPLIYCDFIQYLCKGCYVFARDGLSVWKQDYPKSGQFSLNSVKGVACAMEKLITFWAELFSIAKTFSFFPNWSWQRFALSKCLPVGSIIQQKLRSSLQRFVL